jgi:formylglycine-generating enzyme required for sulfatase activity
MKTSRIAAILVAAWFCSFSVDRTWADTFGSGANTFDIFFTAIGNPGNAPDTTGVPNPAGSVPYSYRIGTHEVSRDMIEKANAAGGLHLQIGDLSHAGGNDPNKPATNISWFDAAKFVNYLNASAGSSPAYKFNSLGLQELWQPSDPGYDPNNLFRNRNAKYFLPSPNEWYKAAFYNPATGTYFDYATGSNTTPTGVGSGTAAGTAVWNQPFANGPALITSAGGLSPYGTMGQSGNVYEWDESDVDLVNDSVLSARGVRGGNWDDVFPDHLATGFRGGAFGPDSGLLTFIGFRVASIIPEPSSLTLVVVGCAIGLLRRRESRI